MKRAFAVAREALALERALPKGLRKTRSEIEFLPAALEIAEAPPSPAAHVTMWSLITFFVIAVLWAWIGHIDVVAMADGRIVSSGRSKVIQPAEIGVVRSIRVHDGMSVAQGDTLVELDMAGSAADRERLGQELLTALATAARARALLHSIKPDVAEAAFVPPARADDAFVAVQRQVVRSEAEEVSARIAQLGDELARRRAERASIEVALRRLEKTLPLIKERVDARNKLAEKGWGSRLLFLELQQQYVEQQEEYNLQKHKLQESIASVAALESQIRQVEAEFRRNKTAELGEAERRAVSLEQEFAKAEQRYGLQRLASPIDGVVQQLAVHTIGGVVTPAQQLMVIVPNNDALEVEAKVLNKDIGFVRVGQHAEVKLETFTFTRYGTVPGEVVSVSGDAIPDEKTPDQPVYSARIRLARSTMNADGREVPLSPGMRATVEIKTDDRRVIEYLLSPLLRYQQESLRER